MKQKFISTKVFDGYSTVFRQWKAETTHCKYLHGYGVSFKIWFEGELDERNWVWDFGGMKRAKTTIDNLMPKDWMDFMFDHTQVRVVPAVGAERFAEFVFNKINTFVKAETKGRVSVKKVEFRENNKNAAVYEPRKNK